MLAVTTRRKAKDNISRTRVVLRQRKQVISCSKSGRSISILVWLILTSRQIWIRSVPRGCRRSSTTRWKSARTALLEVLSTKLNLSEVKGIHRTSSSRKILTQRLSGQIKWPHVSRPNRMSPSAPCSTISRMTYHSLDAPD